MSTNRANIQDLVLNQIRKDRLEITVYLANGVPLKGRVISFDNFTLIMDMDGKQGLVYKHAISTIVCPKSMQLEQLCSETKEK